VWSYAKFLGLSKGTSAPYILAIEAISSSLVETITCSKHLLTLWPRIALHIQSANQAVPRTQADVETEVDFPA